MQSKIPRLIICDDHELVRTAIGRSLTSGGAFQVIGQASTGEGLWHWLKVAESPDLLIMDLTLGSERMQASLDRLTQIVETYPHIPVLVLSMHTSPDVVANVLRLGACGFVGKGSGLDVLTAAITQVVAGSRFVDPAVIAGFGDPKGRSEEAWNQSLTPRELEVMARFCAGQRLLEIAAELGISVKTVSTHKLRLMDKLGVKSNAELVRLGQRHGLY